MQPLIRLSLVLLLVWVPSVVARDAGKAGQKGIFEGDADVGKVRHAGSVEYDSAGKSYRVAGGGENMWFTNDAMHFVWKKVSGDVSLAADVSLIGAKGNAHRKACLMFRQSLEPDSAYVDAALHGDGLTSLQYRDAKGAFTREIQSNVAAPGRLQIEKRGKYVSLSIAETNGTLHPAGGAVRVVFEDPFYFGLAVCAHDDNALEEAKFSKVELDNHLPPLGAKPRLLSTLETVTIASKDRRVAYWTTNHIEAPNWSHDGTYFIFNQAGHLFRLPLAGGEPQLIDTGSANHCNNDHGISPDGAQLAISDNSQDKHSLISLLPITGGTPRLLTKLGPSYWHGWSPDGKTIAYCAQREGEFDVYTMAVEGGEEHRLTTAKGLDDGPEYSPDGKFIYFNSVRSGTMQIWRMRPDGAEQEQVTSDEFNNWFPHISPDGKWLIFLAYEKEVQEHPENKDVMLRIMPVKGGPIEAVAKLFGGQGTMNVPSWSPDSRKVAFVSYQLVP